MPMEFRYMSKKLEKLPFLILCFISSFCLLFGEEAKQPDTSATINHKFSETLHKVVINGKEVSYKATAGTLVTKDANNKPHAQFFFVSYTREDSEKSFDRPLTFCFNGGPGSSSVWLHIGAFGPKRVKLRESGDPLPPYQLVDNEFSLLDITDLVFIDPVSTGYSEPAPGVDPKAFHGVNEDVHSVAEFIRLYTTRFNRWDSPKFIAGESYGTTRAAGLAKYLDTTYNLKVNGLILVSSVLAFQSLDFDESNDLPYLLFLPSYTATAWYHNKLPQELQQKPLDDILALAEEFSLNDYALALLKGRRLEKEKRDNVIQKLAYFTGLSPDYINQSNLRVNVSQFTKELLRKRNLILGRFDSRFIGGSLDPLRKTADYDPSTDAVFGVFTATFNQYVRTDLKWEKDEPYKILADVWPWSFGEAENQYYSVASLLDEEMRRTPGLRVFVANGYYDLATPYFATEYTFDHMGLDGQLKDRVKMGYYDAGHMMYIHNPSLVKLSKDLHQFIKETLEKTEVGKTLDLSR